MACNLNLTSEIVGTSIELIFSVCAAKAYSSFSCATVAHSPLLPLTWALESIESIPHTEPAGKSTLQMCIQCLLFKGDLKESKESA